MSEIGEAFEAMKEAGKARRAKNTMTSTGILEEKGIQFESKNRGAHLVVQGKDGLIDFWPSTGKFISRYDKKHGRGVFNLLRKIGVS